MAPRAQLRHQPRLPRPLRSLHRRSRPPGYRAPFILPSLSHRRNRQRISSPFRQTLRVPNNGCDCHKSQSVFTSPIPSQVQIPRHHSAIVRVGGTLTESESFPLASRRGLGEHLVVVPLVVARHEARPESRKTSLSLVPPLCERRISPVESPVSPFLAVPPRTMTNAEGQNRGPLPTQT